MKKFFSMMAMAMMAVAMVACGGGDDPVVGPDNNGGGNNNDNTGKTQLSAPAPSVASVSETSASISWAAVQNAGSYVYQVNGVEKTTLGTTVSVDGLTDNTTYSFKVKAVPSDMNNYTESLWGEVSFKTNAKQDTPTPGPGTGDGSTPDCFKGSNYVLIALGTGTQEAFLPKEKIVADWRTDDYTNFLYVWEGTYEGNNDAAGPNSFGIVEGWTALKTTSVGWAGAGWCCGGATTGDTVGSDTLAAMNYWMPKMCTESNWYFHFAIKSPEGDKGMHQLTFYPTGATQGVDVKLVVGAPGMAGCDRNYNYDGEWYSFDIPVSELVQKGLIWTNQNPAGTNVVAVVTTSSTGAWMPGMEVNLDGMFFYQK